MLDSREANAYNEQMREISLSPSLLAADFSNLENAIRLIENARAKAIHFDVMDGIFVPQISFGEPVLRAIRSKTSLPFDVHLMTADAEKKIDSFANAGADWITLHAENTVHIHRAFSHIHSLGKKAGIAIVPTTPVSALEEILPLADIVLAMSVNPGFGGQTFIERTLEKIQKLSEIKKARNFSFMISVDGGVNKKNMQTILDAGADMLVSGSAFFRGEML